jgi:hypothetical protein
MGVIACVCLLEDRNDTFSKGVLKAAEEINAVRPRHTTALIAGQTT